MAAELVVREVSECPFFGTLVILSNDVGGIHAYEERYVFALLVNALSVSKSY